MAVTLTAGGSLILGNAAPTKQALSTNYIDFTSSATAGWAQQYLPDLYEAEVERYGDRTVGGFLQATGSEMPMSSDQIIWTEQGRLHLSYTGLDVAAPDGSNEQVISSSNNKLDAHAIRTGQTVVVKAGAGVFKAYVTDASAANTIKVKTYGADITTVTDDTASLFVYGSEFGKGTTGMTGAVTPQHVSLTNKPIILKDKYEISGSDASQIGWVEVTGESGQTGYLWYIKAEGDTRSRFEDYMEMALVEAEEKTNADLTEAEGTEGLFAAIESRGHVGTSFLAASDASDNLADFDDILKKLDKEGAIEENMLFLNRNNALAIDDMLAAMNSYGTGGTSYGVFNNSEDMALNLGFSGFRRGSYDFYKTDWKYLNDASTRGLVGGVDGVLVPAGTSTVYDQILGKNIKRPFLHIRYRASEADDRRMKSWVTGSVGGAATSSLDAMEVHYLTERCLVVQGANNFMIFK
jgi:hypothetical protein